MEYNLSVNKMICTLYVPGSALKSYSTSNGWKEFKKKVAIGKSPNMRKGK
jgi:hypothetical protein